MRNLVCGVVLVGALGCAGSGARGQVVASVRRGEFDKALRAYQGSGASRSVLGDFACTLLLREAWSVEPTRRRAAFVEFSLLGTRARPLLEQLAAAQVPLAERAPALASLVVLGDADAREALRPLALSPGGEGTDSAIVALDAQKDWPAVRAALRSPSAGRRAGALQLLTRAEPDSRALPDLFDVSALDPEPSLRVAALRVLERHGVAAAPGFERAADDASEDVRSAALEGLAHVAPDRASVLLDQQLGAAVTNQALSAALTLLRMQPPRELARAWNTVTLALSHSDVALRARTAVMLRTLPASVIDLAVIRARLKVETSPEVQLGLALALGVKDAPARQMLTQLSLAGGIPAVQAARELALLGDAAAHARLLALRTSDRSAIRATLARALGRELGEVDAVASLLADRDASVRTAAAGAVLAGL
jgi:hypothetical protein